MCKFLLHSHLKEEVEEVPEVINNRREFHFILESH